MVWACSAAMEPGHFAAICLTAKAWLKLGHETEQRFQSLQKIYNRMTEEEKSCV